MARLELRALLVQLVQEFKACQALLVLRARLAFKDSKVSKDQLGQQVSLVLMEPQVQLVLLALMEQQARLVLQAQLEFKELKIGRAHV